MDKEYITPDFNLIDLENLIAWKSSENVNPGENGTPVVPMF